MAFEIGDGNGLSVNRQGEVLLCQVSNRLPGSIGDIDLDEFERSGDLVLNLGSAGRTPHSAGGHPG